MIAIRNKHLNTWSLPVWWILASFAGWLAGMALGVGITLAARLIPWVNEDRFLPYAVLLSLGLTVGVSQWSVMKSYFYKAARWIPATFSGFALTLLVFAGANLIKFQTSGLWDDAILLSLIGIAIGIPQWWMLRKDHHGASLWILASAAGFLSFLWLIAQPTNFPAEFIIRTALTGTVAAAIPGMVLIWLVRQGLNAGPSE
jgi:hypothetical protein